MLLQIDLSIFTYSNGYVNSFFSDGISFQCNVGGIQIHTYVTGSKGMMLKRFDLFRHPFVKLEIVCGV